MFEHCLYPDSLHPQKLDEMLARGWFRMGQSIFTTQYTLFENRMYRTIWLRHILDNYQETKTIINLKKRNKEFKIEVKKAHITDAHEFLFYKYKQSVYFNAAASLEQLLNGYSLKQVNIYNTYEINLYHKGNLIACSYFDVGHNSAEGISSYYAPAYKAHSLGKYLIYLQVEICKANGLKFFYPGYFVPGFPHLDYKLSIGTDCLEFLDPESLSWHPIEKYNDTGIPILYQEYFIY